MQKGIIKNVNRITGEPVDAKDLASIFSGIVGNESGVLTVFEELRLEKISDNKVRLHSGVYSLKGHMLYIPKGSYEDFEIDSGTLGANRIDLLVAEYVKNGEGEGEDTLQFKIIKGNTTSGAAQPPQLTQQDISANGITHQESLYQIRMNGLNASLTPTKKEIKNTAKITKDISDLDTNVKSLRSDLNDRVSKVKIRYNRKYLGASEQWYRPIPSSDIPVYGMITFDYVIQNGVGKPIGWGKSVYTIHNNTTTIFRNETSGSEVKMGVSEGRFPHFHHKLGYDIFIVFTYSIGVE